MKFKKSILLISFISVSIIFTGINQSDARKGADKKNSKRLYNKNYKKNDKLRRFKEFPFHVKRKGSQKYRVTFTFTLENSGMNLTKLVVALPFPDIKVKHYQKVSRLNLPRGWQQVKSSNGEYYARLEISGNNLPGAGKNKNYSYSFDVVLYGLQASGSINKKVTSTLNGETRKFFGKDHPFIDRNNRNIRSISATLWNQSGGNLLTYAKKAYEYVATQYSYRNAYTGLHPLTDVLSNNGGDCGNLSSIFISLMQARNVPARHLVAISPRQNYHAWAEFYIDKGGWIPVDVTYKNNNARGNYFANYSINTAHIIVHKRLNMNITDINGGTFITPILQLFAYWVHGTGNVNQLKPSFKVTSQRI